MSHAPEDSFSYGTFVFSHIETEEMAGTKKTARGAVSASSWMISTRLRQPCRALSPCPVGRAVNCAEGESHNRNFRG
jgi:hypothetical protein